MKTKIKSLLLTVIMFLTLSLGINAQTPSALSIQGGYSWLNGVVGGEYQYGHIAISGGWMPARMPISGDKVDSYGGAFSVYTGNFNETSCYASLGFASQGYRYEYYNSWGGSGESTSSMTIVMAGMKYGSDGINIKLGGGYGWCQYGNAWTFEATLGVNLFKNNNK